MGEIHVFLNSTLVGDEFSASHFGRFTSKERVPSTYWTGGWVGPRAGLDEMERGNSLSYRDSNSDPSVVQPVASRYTDCVIPALKQINTAVNCRTTNNTSASPLKIEWKLSSFLTELH
jgi:hypothetical protein